MTLDRDLLVDSVLDIISYEHIIAGGDGPYKGCTSSMVDLGYYSFRPFNIIDKVASK